MTGVLAMATVLIGLTLCRNCGGCGERRILLPLVHFHIPPFLLPILGIVGVVPAATIASRDDRRHSATKTDNVYVS